MDREFAKTQTHVSHAQPAKQPILSKIASLPDPEDTPPFGLKVTEPQVSSPSPDGLPEEKVSYTGSQRIEAKENAVTSSSGIGGGQVLQNLHYINNLLEDDPRKKTSSSFAAPSTFLPQAPSQVILAPSVILQNHQRLPQSSSADPLGSGFNTRRSSDVKPQFPTNPDGPQLYNFDSNFSTNVKTEFLLRTKRAEKQLSHSGSRGPSPNKKDKPKQIFAVASNPTPPPDETPLEVLGGSAKMVNKETGTAEGDQGRYTLYKNSFGVKFSKFRDFDARQKYFLEQYCQKHKPVEQDGGDEELQQYFKRKGLSRINSSTISNKSGTEEPVSGRQQLNQFTTDSEEQPSPSKLNLPLISGSPEKGFRSTLRNQDQRIHVIPSQEETEEKEDSPIKEEPILESEVQISPQVEASLLVNIASQDSNEIKIFQTRAQSDFKRVSRIESAEEFEKETSRRQEESHISSHQFQPSIGQFSHIADLSKLVSKAHKKQLIPLVKNIISDASNHTYVRRIEAGRQGRAPAILQGESFSDFQSQSSQNSKMSQLKPQIQPSQELLQMTDNTPIGIHNLANQLPMNRFRRPKQKMSNAYMNNTYIKQNTGNKGPLTKKQIVEIRRLSQDKDRLTGPAWMSIHQLEQDSNVNPASKAFALKKQYSPRRSVRMTISKQNISENPNRSPKYAHQDTTPADSSALRDGFTEAYNSQQAYQREVQDTLHQQDSFTERTMNFQFPANSGNPTQTPILRNLVANRIDHSQSTQYEKSVRRRKTNSPTATKNDHLYSNQQLPTQSNIHSRRRPQNSSQESNRNSEDKYLTQSKLQVVGGDRNNNLSSKESSSVLQQRLLPNAPLIKTTKKQQFKPLSQFINESVAESSVLTDRETQILKSTARISAQKSQIIKSLHSAFGSSTISMEGKDEKGKRPDLVNKTSKERSSLDTLPNSKKQESLKAMKARIQSLSTQINQIDEQGIRQALRIFDSKEQQMKTGLNSASTSVLNQPLPLQKPVVIKGEKTLMDKSRESSGGKQAKRQASLVQQIVVKGGAGNLKKMKTKTSLVVKNSLNLPFQFDPNKRPSHVYSQDGDEDKFGASSSQVKKNSIDNSFGSFDHEMLLKRKNIYEHHHQNETNDFKLFQVPKRPIESALKLQAGRNADSESSFLRGLKEDLNQIENLYYHNFVAPEEEARLSYSKIGFSPKYSKKSTLRPYLFSRQLSISPRNSSKPSVTIRAQPQTAQQMSLTEYEKKRNGRFTSILDMKKVGKEISKFKSSERVDQVRHQVYANKLERQNSSHVTEPTEKRRSSQSSHESSCSRLLEIMNSMASQIKSEERKPKKEEPRQREVHIGAVSSDLQRVLVRRVHQIKKPPRF